MKKIIFISIVVITSISCLNAQTTDKEIKFGGRIMYDMATWGSDDFENAGSEFRRVRFFNSGKLFGYTKYKLQINYSSGNISYKDVWIELGGLPMDGSLRVGHFKEPFRLEALTSSKYITFIERALPIAFSPERNTGAMYQLNLQDRISVQAGMFTSFYSKFPTGIFTGIFEGDSYGNDKNAFNNVNATARITYLLMNHNDRLLHLGAAVRKRKNSDNTYGFSVRPENHLGTKLLTPSFENVDETNITGLEIAYISGPLSLQGEYILTAVSLDPEIEMHSTQYELNGYYGKVSYFLTGESRLYKSSYEGFNRVKPKNNYGENGWGAFEIAARVSQIDLSSVENGTLDDITLGLNWYLNPNTRVMINYVMGEMTNYQGDITKENAVMMRVQLDF